MEALVTIPQIYEVEYIGMKEHFSYSRIKYITLGCAVSQFLKSETKYILYIKKESYNTFNTVSFDTDHLRMTDKLKSLFKYTGIIYTLPQLKEIITLGPNHTLEYHPEVQKFLENNSVRINHH